MARRSSAVRRILTATDRSETAGRAVAWAAEMAERYDAELIVLQVLVQDIDDPADAPAREQAERELARYAAEAVGPRARALVAVDSDPSRAIVDTAEDEGADVVVVGNVNMSGRKEFLLGNVPNRVSHNARCTVVIVNTAEPEPSGLGRLFRR